MTTPSPFDAFDAFVAPARARPALWRTLAGALFAAALWLFALGTTLPFAARAGGLATPPGILLFLTSFAALAAGVALAARLLQARRAATLLGPGGLRARPFAAGVAVVTLAAIPSGLVIASLAPPTLQFAPSAWAAWLPLALPALLVQTAAEEIAFRGYLLQSLAARFRSPLIWWLLPAFLFGALHWNPGALGPNAALGVFITSVVGLALADVTVRTGNLSAAIGLHFANNVLAMLVLAMPSPVSGLSLLLTGIEPSDAAAVRLLMLVDLAATILVWLAWRLLRRRSSGPRPSLHSPPGSL